MSEDFSPPPAIRDEAIAIVGLSCRFPDASTPDEFWRNLEKGHDSTREFSDEEILHAGGDPAHRAQANFVTRGIALPEMEWFDAGFFGYSPRDAEILDPQQRLFLECAWEALEDAGFDPSRQRHPVGVFASADLSAYLVNLYSQPGLVAAAGEYAIALGNDKDHIATRVAYHLDCHGPAITVQSACSSSLVAVCTACQSLASYQCDLALAGGSAMGLAQPAGYFWHEGGIDSPDGRCRAFDAAARGTIGGSGAGAVVLRRYADAVREGDRILAVIRGYGVSNDGQARIGYTAPSAEGQARAILAAQMMADVSPESIGYIECHGTGTALGDPIEIMALTRVFRSQTQRRQFCGLGSVKTNIGHLNAAAGVAGLIKTVLALRHRQLPPTLHFHEPNPRLDLPGSPFYVVDRLRAWEGDASPRRAGVSSFGLGGTNAHVILEEVPSPLERAPADEWQILPLSAKTPQALDRLAPRLAGALGSTPPPNLADTAWTLQTGRKAFRHRAAVVANGHGMAARALGERKRGEWMAGVADGPLPIVFLFPGQGTSYAGAARGLYETEPVFREEIDRACATVRALGGLDLAAVLLSPGGPAHAASTALEQPALFAFEYALARLWMHWGLAPHAVAGHSLGEYAAATIAGVFRFEDALELVTLRGSLMEATEPGAMLAVFVPEREADALASGRISLAAVNGPRECVLSGPVAEIGDLEARLGRVEVPHRRLRVNRAFHSSLMDPVIPGFLEHLRRIPVQAPAQRWISTLTGRWMEPGDALDPAYWARQLRQTVRFEDCLVTLQQESPQACVEVGPGKTLATLAATCLGGLAVSPLSSASGEEPPARTMRQALSELWVRGAEVKWTAVSRGETRRRVSLPTYPFERQRYWVSRGRRIPEAPSGEPRRPMEEWFLAPRWKPVAAPAAQRADPAGEWLLFSGADPGAQELVELLRQSGDVVRQVGPDSCATASGRGVERPQLSGWERAFDELQSAGHRPRRIVCWCDAGRAVEPEAAFYSLLSLARALARNLTGAEMELTVVTRGAAAILPREQTVPGSALLAGACRVLAQEQPNLRARAIDLPFEPSEPLAEALAAELRNEAREPLVALRPGARWIVDYAPVRLDAAAGVRQLRRGGVYVITGGLGGMGLTFARHLAATAGAKLLLIGRTPLPPREQWSAWLEKHPGDDAASKIRCLLQIEAAGGEVMVAAADVTDAAGMRALAERARQRWGRICGVIHAAGVPGGGMAALKTEAVAAGVLAAKVRGTEVLWEAFDGASLDFMILCSSLNALLGGFGQIDYSAANSYLDGFARQHARGETRVVSVNWDAWREVGMVVETAVPRACAQARHDGLAGAITPEEGTRALDFLLSAEGPQIVVSTHDLQARLRQALAPAAMPKAVRADPETRYPRPMLPREYVAPRDATEQRIAAEWCALLALEEVGIYDEFVQCGGHSLVAVRLLERLGTLFQVRISIAEFFAAPTVAGLAEALRRDENAARVEVIAGLQQQMDGLSVDELEAWLRREQSGLAATIA